MPDPSIEQLRAKAAEIVARPDYDLDAHHVETAWLADVLTTIVRWLLTPFRWVYESTEGLPDVFRWMLILLLAAMIIGLLWHIVYTLIRAVQGDHGGGSLIETAKRVVDPVEWERRAATAADGGDYITAVRYLFRAALSGIERSEKKAPRPGTTNRELLRRYRNRPDVVEPLRRFVETIDRKWYGEDVCFESDYAQCATAHEGLRRAISRGAIDAVRA